MSSSELGDAITKLKSFKFPLNYDMKCYTKVSSDQGKENRKIQKMADKDGSGDPN